jgi:hypothetical protein
LLEKGEVLYAWKKGEHLHIVDPQDWTDSLEKGKGQEAQDPGEQAMKINTCIQSSSDGEERITESERLLKIVKTSLLLGSLRIGDES